MTLFGVIYHNIFLRPRQRGVQTTKRSNSIQTTIIKMFIIKSILLSLGITKAIIKRF